MNTALPIEREVSFGSLLIWWTPSSPTQLKPKSDFYNRFRAIKAYEERSNSGLPQQWSYCWLHLICYSPKLRSVNLLRRAMAFISLSEALQKSALALGYSSWASVATHSEPLSRWLRASGHLSRERRTAVEGSNWGGSGDCWGFSQWNLFIENCYFVVLLIAHLLLKLD